MFSFIIYFTQVVYVCNSISSNSSHSSPFPPGIHILVLYLCVSISTLQIRPYLPFFQILHICVKIQLFFLLTYFRLTVPRSIHLSSNDPVSFFFMAEKYSIVYMYHIFFLYSFVDVYLLLMNFSVYLKGRVRVLNISTLLSRHSYHHHHFLPPQRHLTFNHRKA